MFARAGQGVTETSFRGRIQGNLERNADVGLSERGAVSSRCPMELERIDLMEQIERCRRLARNLSDEQLRHSLEELAEDYEAQLTERNCTGFMLRDRG